MIFFCKLNVFCIFINFIIIYRSLVEETTRSHQDNSKRNVPVGIGKKFSLSSGALLTNY